MALSDDKKKEYIKRLLLSRMRILCNNGFYGLLLMHMKFAIDEDCRTACTDGQRIYFGPQFLETLSDNELDFIMMHEIMHVVLKHVYRNGERDPERFNIACDIVVNSNILKSLNMNHQLITLKYYGEAMHVAPDGKEGYNYTAEEVYEMLPPNSPTLDDHSRWNNGDEDKEIEDDWEKRLEDAWLTIQIRDSSNGSGSIPMGAERLLKELKKPQIDWRTILNDFVQEEVVDYSFTPPDRRFDDNPFYLPDFNEKDIVPQKILFMIDTSGSMDDDMITAAYSEVKGAIDQFDGKLEGWLGFFDAKVVPPEPFTSEEEFRIITPKGGGGTNFHVIFQYVKEEMSDDLPASIIILTDGFAHFPDKRMSMEIPVLWLLNNDEVEPPWGKVARIKI